MFVASPTYRGVSKLAVSIFFVSLKSSLVLVFSDSKLSMQLKCPKSQILPKNAKTKQVLQGYHSLCFRSHPHISFHICKYLNRVLERLSHECGYSSLREDLPNFHTPWSISLLPFPSPAVSARNTNRCHRRGEPVLNLLPDFCFSCLCLDQYTYESFSIVEVLSQAVAGKGRGKMGRLSRGGCGM